MPNDLFRGGGELRGFEGARAPPECTNAPSRCQKHPLKLEENVDKSSFKTLIQHRYGDFSINRGKSAKETAEFPPFALNWMEKHSLAFRQFSTHVPIWEGETTKIQNSKINGQSAMYQVSLDMYLDVGHVPGISGIRTCRYLDRNIV